MENNGTLNNQDRVENQSLLINYDQVQNHNTLINEGFIENYGTLDNFGTLTNTDTILNDGTLTNYGTLTNNGSVTLLGFSVLTNNGALNGHGTVFGNLADAGILAPGNSAGVLTVDGDVVKTGGSLQIELGGVFDGGGDKSLTEFDWLDITGNLDLVGSLDVQFINGFTLNNLYSFKIINIGGTLTGQFDSLDEGGIVGNFGGADLFITYLGGDGNDVVLYNNFSAVPEPGSVGLVMLGIGLMMIRRRRRPSHPDSTCL